MHTYVVVNLLENIDGQDFDVSKAPLHLTLSNTFYSNLSLQKLMNVLEDISRRHRPFTFKTKSREFFGENHDISVTEVVRSKQLEGLHVELTDHVDDLVFKNPEYSKENYRPHITDQGDKKLAVNIERKIDNFTLIELHDDKAEIKGVIRLQ